ncbi:MAG: hypothetical protein AAB453_00680 [Patescibacteria group bacterium]
MKNKSTKNALLAVGYIVIVATVMFYGPKLAGIVDKPDTVLAPIAMISLLTLSVAVMGYLFFWTPLELYLGGDKAGAVKTLLHTIATFAVMTIILIALMIFM